jgi:hypothetical protein
MDLGNLGRLEASASIIGSSGAAVVARGCTVARTGTGVYTVTLGRDLDSADSIALAIPRGSTANGNAAVAQTSDSVKTVNTFVGVTATDLDVDVAIFRIASGNF